MSANASGGGGRTRGVERLDISLYSHAVQRLAERGRGRVDLEKGAFVRIIRMRRADGSRGCWVLPVPDGVLIGDLRASKKNRTRLAVRTFLTSEQFEFTQRNRKPLVPVDVLLFQIRTISGDSRGLADRPAVAPNDTNEEADDDRQSDS